MELKPLFAAALVALSLGLVACGDSGSDSTSSGAETTPPASEETTEEAESTESTESEPAPSGEASKSEKVEIVEFTYQPDPVVVQAGGKVIWQNQDAAPHTATADDGSFDTGTIEKDKIGSETFKEAGTFTYFCEIHPTMHGTVEVVE
ncbi:MAG TPA: cupredoxin family copper-binding protein [Solirubrobacterales bacterium]|nr:cupredoxin family copper-binding protein [Solirubrobacterales bacterium]